MSDSTERTLLVLGGSRLILPIIETARSFGCRVVTCDYLPDNVAHPYADEYLNVSIVDKEDVLEAARSVNATAITSFGTDPGVIAAAYAAEELGLPFQCSYEAATLLQNKGAFRTFLTENGFPCPQSVLVKTPEGAELAVDGLRFPVIVKPTDAAGSKGVTRVDTSRVLGEAIDAALGFSMSRTVIVEEFIEKQGAQLSAEAFTVDGKVTAVCFMDQIFDDEGPNPYAPVGNIVPPAHDPEVLATLERDLQRLSDLLELRTGIYNVEARIGTDGVPYILEVSPRGGGNRLAEFITTATGIDLITATVQACLGEVPDSDWTSTLSGVWAQRMLIDRQGGTFEALDAIDPPGGSVQDTTLWLEPGDRVEPFIHATYAFGSAWVRFDDRDTLNSAVEDPEFLKAQIQR